MAMTQEEKQKELDKILSTKSSKDFTEAKIDGVRIAYTFENGNAAVMVNGPDFDKYLDNGGSREELNKKIELHVSKARIDDIDVLEAEMPSIRLSPKEIEQLVDKMVALTAEIVERRIEKKIGQALKDLSLANTKPLGRG